MKSELSLISKRTFVSRNKCVVASVYINYFDIFIFFSDAYIESTWLGKLDSDNFSTINRDYLFVIYLFFCYFILLYFIYVYLCISLIYEMVFAFSFPFNDKRVITVNSVSYKCFYIDFKSFIVFVNLEANFMRILLARLIEDMNVKLAVFYFNQFVA